MTRDELILAVCDVIHSGPPVPDCQSARLAIDAVEPLIRADERATIKYEMGVLQWEGLRLRQERADLRAKVEEQRDTAIEMRDLNPDVYMIWQQDADTLNDVLALFDGDTP